MRMQGWLFKGTGVLTAKALFNPRFPSRGDLLEKEGRGGGGDWGHIFLKSRLPVRITSVEETVTMATKYRLCNSAIH